MTHDELFELGSSYDEMLQQGLDLAGESKDYFIDGRVAYLRERLERRGPIRRILDFACGVGDASQRLADAFDAEEVVGVDVASGAIAEARRRVGDPRIRFAELADLEPSPHFDLCYVNGAYHHIPVDQRDAVTRRIHDVLRADGAFALFENNPYSPAARLVMRRIPFDRDAVMLRPAVARRVMARAGFDVAGPTAYLFVFPNALRALRRLEPRARPLPIGAQYLVLGRRR
jgi:trans-aconitate methyltransferase